MTTYLRVKDKSTGAKYSEISSVVDANPDAFQVLKQDAVDVAGDPLLPEYPGDQSSASTTTAASGKES